MAGGKATFAVLDKVETRAVPCTYQGLEPRGEHESGGFASHVKIHFRRFHLSEKRRDARGAYQYAPVTLTKKSKALLSMLQLELHGRTFDLMATSFGPTAYSSFSKLEVTVSKSAASLPTQALLSLCYDSPLGGKWYVHRQPVDIMLGDLEESRPHRKGCAVM
jgi:hypothetical protein